MEIDDQEEFVFITKMLSDSHIGPVRVGATKNGGQWQYMTSSHDVTFTDWLNVGVSEGCMWLVDHRDGQGWGMVDSRCSGRLDGYVCEIDM